MIFYQQTVIMHLLWGLSSIIQLALAKRHFAIDQRMWEQQQATKIFQNSNATDSTDGTVQALYVVEETHKKMFRSVFPIQIKETQIIRGPPLGDGSFGVVYNAKVAKNNNRLAVKTSNKLQYTKVEYLALKKLDSRYFPKVYFFGITKFGPNRLVAFFGMEMLKGSDMFQLMKHYDTAMSGGYIHRDIKPENIMCCDNGTIKLIDFGGCLPAPNEKVTFSEWFGTEEYMAPEQLDCVHKGTKCCSYTRLADWWAAGATIYYASKFTDIKRGKPIVTDDANLTNLINRLCSNNPNDRKFNYKKHPYFKGFNLKKTD